MSVMTLRSYEQFFGHVKQILIDNLVTNSGAPEPEGSLPYLQEPATGSYPEPTGSNLHSPSQPL
jgi:hypothetical protein